MGNFEDEIHFHLAARVFPTRWRSGDDLSIALADRPDAPGFARVPEYFIDRQSWKRQNPGQGSQDYSFGHQLVYEINQKVPSALASSTRGKAESFTV